MVGLMFPAACLSTRGMATTTRVEILGTPVELLAQEQVLPTPENVPITQALTPIPLTPPAVMTEDVALYLMKNTAPDELIRYVWRNESPATIERALVIACREGGMGKGSGRTWQEACSPSHRHPAVPYDPSCGADNPTSSASGLVQFIGGWRGWGGFDWNLIVNRDCLEDVQMFYAAWQANGWSPWQ